MQRRESHRASESEATWRRKCGVTELISTLNDIKRNVSINQNALAASRKLASAAKKKSGAV